MLAHLYFVKTKCLNGRRIALAKTFSFVFRGPIFMQEIVNQRAFVSGGLYSERTYTDVLIP